MNEARNHCVIDSPVGRLRADFRCDQLTRLKWTIEPLRGAGSQAAADLIDQIAQYFDGERESFDIEISLAGTAFQKAVWRAMCQIPYGGTRTYGSVARDLDSAARAVGVACGDNPIPIVVPCHRILAADGLGGYSGRGGLTTKMALLRLEGAHVPAEQLDLPIG